MRAHPAGHGSNAMPLIGLVLCCAALAARCAKAPPEGPAPDVVAAREALVTADGLARQGCYRCLEEALAAYTRVARGPTEPARAGRDAVRTALLLARRQQELGLATRRRTSIEPTDSRTSSADPDDDAMLRQVIEVLPSRIPWTGDLGDLEAFRRRGALIRDNLDAWRAALRAAAPGDSAVRVSRRRSRVRVSRGPEAGPGAVDRGASRRAADTLPRGRLRERRAAGAEGRAARPGAALLRGAVLPGPGGARPAAAARGRDAGPGGLQGHPAVADPHAGAGRRQSGARGIRARGGGTTTSPSGSRRRTRRPGSGRRRRSPTSAGTPTPSPCSIRWWTPTGTRATAATGARSTSINWARWRRPGPTCGRRSS